MCPPYNLPKCLYLIHTLVLQDLSIFVFHRFSYFNYTEEEGSDSLVNAMDTCTKMGRQGAKLTQVTSTEQFKIWHKDGNDNPVYIFLIQSEQATQCNKEPAPCYTACTQRRRFILTELLFLRNLYASYSITYLFFGINHRQIHRHIFGSKYYGIMMMNSLFTILKISLALHYGETS